MADVEIDLETTNPKELVGLGIKAFAIGDFSNSAAAFGRATQLMAQEHGDEHDLLGEIYLHYARALLEVSREEAGPLGEGIPHGESDSDDDEEVDSENGVESAENQDEKPENKEEKSDDKEEKSDDKDTKTDVKDDKSDDKDESKTAEEKLESESKEDKKKEDKIEVKEKENETSEEKTDDKVEEKQTNGANGVVDESAGTSKEDAAKSEDCTDLQLAWEVLEVAKKIFTNRGDSGKEHLAETLILLGEVGMESENFNDGINDMKAGLEMQKSLFEISSRKLAETYYKLGTALSTVPKIDEAITNFELSMDTLKKRIELLQKEIDEDKTDKKGKLGEEIENMKALIPEIEEKISDTKSVKEEVAEKLKKQMISSASKDDKDEPKEATAAQAPSSSKINNISHLVKRKRKADETDPEPNTEVQPAKKPTP